MRSIAFQVFFLINAKLSLIQSWRVLGWKLFELCVCALILAFGTYISHLYIKLTVLTQLSLWSFWILIHITHQKHLTIIDSWQLTPTEFCVGTQMMRKILKMPFISTLRWFILILEFKLFSFFLALQHITSHHKNVPFVYFSKINYYFSSNFLFRL